MARQGQKYRVRGPGLPGLPQGDPKDKICARPFLARNSAIEERMEAGSEAEKIPAPRVQISSPGGPPEPIRFDQGGLHEVPKQDLPDSVKVWQKKIRQAQKKTSGKVMEQGKGLYGRAAAGLVSWDVGEIGIFPAL